MATSAGAKTAVRPLRVTVAENRLDTFDARPADDDSANALRDAVELLRHGEAVAFPTETVYGLGANALHADAVARIFAAKRRPGDNPLIVHVSSLAMVERFAALPDVARPLVERFWPGPLTLLLPALPGRVPANVTCGLPTVGVRMPAHPVARLLIDRCDFPIAAPSANLSGRPSPTTAHHVAADLDGRIPLVLDGGPAQVGVESTVVDLLSTPPALLRPGGVTYEQLLPFLPNLQVFKKHFENAQLEARPTTPGMKYRHYSPDARVVLLETAASSGADAESAWARMQAAMEDEIQQARQAGKRFAIIRTHGARTSYAGLGLVAWSEVGVGQQPPPFPAGIDYPLGVSDRPEEVARGLFAALRDLDAAGVDVILVEGIDDAHEGLAVMNRLRKAASNVRVV